MQSVRLKDSKCKVMNPILLRGAESTKKRKKLNRMSLSRAISKGKVLMAVVRIQRLSGMKKNLRLVLGLLIRRDKL